MKFFSAISAIRFAIYLPALGVVFGLTGCTETSAPHGNSGVLSETTVSRQVPLSPHALVKFSQLKPAIQTPVNVPYPRQLHPNAVKAVTAAGALVKKKDLHGAIEKLQRAQGFDPDNPQIHRLLGETYFNMGDFAQAYEHLALASKYFGNDIALQLGLGRSCVVLKNYDQAIRHFRIALICSDAKESDSDYAIAILFLYRLLNSQGYSTAALECNERLSQLLRNHAREYYDAPALQNVLMNPEVLLVERGQLLLQLHKMRQAAVMLDKAYRRDRSNEKTAELLLRVRIGNKQHVEGEDLVVSLAELDPPIDALPMLTRALCISSGDAATPKRIWERLHKQTSSVSPELKLALIEALLKLGADEDAREFLENLSRQAPSNLQAATMLGIIDARSGDSMGALRRLGKLVTHTSENPPDLAPAIREIIAAGKVKPVDLMHRFGAETYRNMGDDKYAQHYVAGFLARHGGKICLAADHFKRSIDARPDFYPAYDALLGIRLDQGQSREVNAILDQIQNQACKGFYYYFMLGKVRLEQGKLNEAITAFQTAQDQNASHLPTLLKLAEAYQLEASRKNDDPRLLQSASETLRMAMGLDPSRGDIYRLLFDCYVRQGNMTAARRLAGRALRALPQKSLGRELAAEAYMLSGEYKKAAQILQNLAQQSPGNPDIRVLQIRNELMRHPGVPPKIVYDALVTKLEVLHQKYPDNFRVQRVLAQLYGLSIPGWYGKAADVWENLWRQHPQDICYGKALGVSLFKAGQYKRLMPVARRLVKQIPRDETMRIMLAEVLLENGQVDEAIKLATAWWKRNKRNMAYISLLWKIYTESRRFDQGAKFTHKLRDYTKSGVISMQRVRYFEMEFLVKAKNYDKLTMLVTQAKHPATVANLAAFLLIQNQHPAAAVTLLENMLPPPPTDKPPVEKDSCAGAARGNGSTTKPTTPPTSRPVARPTTKAAAKFARSENCDKYSMLNTYIWVLVKAAQLDKARAFVKQYPLSSALGRRLHRDLFVTLANQHPVLASELLTEYRTELPKHLTPGRLKKMLTACDVTQYYIFVAEQKYTEALKLSNKHLGKTPKNMVWLRLKLLVLNELGDMVQATKLSKQIYEQNPDDPEWQNGYAYQLTEMGTNLDTAEKLVRQSLEQLTSKQGDAPLAQIDTLGWVFYKQGKFSKAGEVFEEILERVRNSSSTVFVDESHPVMWDHAGDVAYRLGWKKCAVKYWTAAVEDAQAKIKEYSSYELRVILKKTPDKIAAVKKGRPAMVAPLGKKTRRCRTPGCAGGKTIPGKTKKSSAIPADK